MNKGRIIFIAFLSFCFISALYGKLPAAEKAKQQKATKETKAKEIGMAAEADSNHPEYEEGLSCNDCHEIKLDANTTATQVWLSGESPGRAAGEGVMPKDRTWKEIVKIIGGIKTDSKTFVLGTSLNNEPLTTTAEFTLDSEKKVLYGFHEMGTEKLIHIRNNPKVSLNWHREFESFSDFLCVQIKGHAELIEGIDKDFERILIDFLPYEAGARVSKDATAKQREERLKKFRGSLRKGFVISKIVIDRVTVATVDFAREGFRRYQRWER